MNISSQFSSVKKAKKRKPNPYNVFDIRLVMSHDIWYKVENKDSIVWIADSAIIQTMKDLHLLHKLNGHDAIPHPTNNNKLIVKDKFFNKKYCEFFEKIPFENKFVNFNQLIDEEDGTIMRIVTTT